MQSTQLQNRSLLRLSGPDTSTFLQNIVTCDVEGLSDGDLTFGALLSPQGKVLFDFFVHKTGDAFVLDTHRDQGENLKKRLTFYKLRADVDITALPDSNVSVSWNGDPASGNDHVDPRLPALGQRHYDQHPPVNAMETDWNAHRISLGVPQSVDDFALETVFPHDVLMDQFENSGVDFSKGCYVGQEVVSRMQHRSSARNRFVLVQADSDLPEMGTEVAANDRKLGVMGSSIGGTGLALVRIDKVGAALNDGHQLSVAGQEIEITVPAFVTFEISRSDTAS